MAISNAVSPLTMHSTSNPKTASTPSCTHTFDAWRAFAFSYSAQQAVSGRYGVDYRFAPEPSSSERRTLRLLDSVARGLGPTILKRAAVQFDYIENANARAHENYPCALPSAHVLPSKPPQPSTQPLTQPHAQDQSISTSSSATPRASPEHERFHAHHAYQHHQDHLADVFFNFDLASPSEASAPPDTDVEQGNDTEGTDTESERELRLSDLEGPIALRRVTGHGRVRGERRARAGSASTNSASSGPGISPVSPSIVRPNASAPYSSIKTNLPPTSALRTVYGRRTSDVSPSTQTFSQTQLPSSIPSPFPAAVSESGAGIVGPGAGGSTSPSSGGGSGGLVGLSAAARAKVRGRGVGGPKSEPDPDITPTNTAGVATGPVGGGMQSGGGYSVGLYGYRYPVHPQYLGSASGASTGHAQNRVGAYVGYDAAKGDIILTQTHSSIQAANPSMNQQWQASSSTTTTDYGMGSSMDIDLDMGGWGRVSDPLPVDLCYGISGLPYSSPYASQTETQTQNQATGTYQNQAYIGQQNQYPQSQQQQSGLADTQMSYYTPTSGAPTSNPVLSVNPSLNMSPTKWKGSNAGSPTIVAAGSGRQHRTTSQSHVQGRGQGSYWPTSDLRGGM